MKKWRSKKAKPRKSLAQKKAEIVLRDKRFREGLRLLGLPQPEAEVKLVANRKFAWDFVWRNEKVALEIQGGIFSGGAHGRGAGIKRDMEKANLAALEGYRCLFLTPKEIGVDALGLLDVDTTHLLMTALGRLP